MSSTSALRMSPLRGCPRLLEETAAAVVDLRQAGVEPLSRMAHQGGPSKLICDRPVCNVPVDARPPLSAIGPAARTADPISSLSSKFGPRPALNGGPAMRNRETHPLNLFGIGNVRILPAMRHVEIDQYQERWFFRSPAHFRVRKACPAKGGASTSRAIRSVPIPAASPTGRSFRALDSWE